MEEMEIIRERNKRKNFGRDDILLNSRRLGSLCKIIADHFALKAKQNRKRIEVVIGHPVIANFVAYWLADEDSSRQDVLAIPATKKEILLRSGTVEKCVIIDPKHLRHIKRRTCLIIWDAINPEEIAEVCEAVVMAAEIFGVGALRNEKKGVTAEFLGVPRIFCAVNGAK